jgi:Fe-S-cluster-containing hydrogenase component 2
MSEDLKRIIQEDRDTRTKSQWKGNALEYLELVRANPDLAKLSHKRMFDMIASQGISELNIDESPRLKRIPVFIGTKAELSQWKESKLCETICPTHAIKVTAEAIMIDDRGCISCGLCVEIAPEGLLEIQNDNASSPSVLIRNQNA